MKLLWRAIFAFLALPTIVAGVVPVLLMRGTPIAHRLVGAGVAVLLLGAVLLIWCVRDFLVAGRGTLAPWDPPQRLVVVGLYRYTRNPMYVAVLTIVAGWALLYGSRWLAVYGVALAVAFHLRVRWHEEPWLQRRYGAAWQTYAAQTPRWFPRLRAWPE